MRRSYSERRLIIMGIIISVTFIYTIRLVYMQLIDDSYAVSASNNSHRYVTIYPGRGNIYDRFGKLLVYNEATYDVMVVPNLVKKMDTTSFCKLLGITHEDFIKAFKKAYTYSKYKSSVFEKQISKEAYGFLQENLYKFPGFYVQPRTLRKYPYPIAAHTLGYVGEVSQRTIEKNSYYAMGDYIGISGMEKSYEEDLRGRKGVKIMVVDVHNREKGSFANGKFDTSAILGKNLYTELDRDLQVYGELLMSNKRGSIVAIDPKTGGILALISAPTYDPNLLVGRYRTDNYKILTKDSMKPLFNRALMAMYPPGSTFKLANALIGQQMGVTFPNTTYNCSNGFHFGGLTVGCHPHPSSVDLNFSIQTSCNNYYCRVFMAIMSSKKYKTTTEAFLVWRNYLLQMGFGKRFETDLAYELKGNVPTQKFYDNYHGKGRWNAINIISCAIGQGEILTTPMQLANFAATIANRGYYYTPHLVKAIGSQRSPNTRYPAKKNIVAINKAYYERVVEGMYNVVEHGTGRGARIDSMAICAKTGTAQNPQGKDHSIFIAFAPKDDPKIAIAVFVENAGFGATWAAPIASLMIEKYIKREIKRPQLEERMVNANLIGH